MKSKQKILDVATLEAFAADVGDRAFPTLLDTFLGEMRRWIASLPTELAEGKLDVVGRTAHNIKSCAAALGAGYLRTAAESLERVAREGEADGASRQVEELGDAATPALREIERLRASL